MRYLVVGAAGYIAERHVAAIHNIGGDVVGICDPCDTVGYIDRYFPDCEYWRDIEKAYEECDANYAVLCTPNNQHVDHTINALDNGFDVICEKPIATRIQDATDLLSIDRDKRVRTILQLRYHPAVAALKDYILQKRKRGRGLVISVDYFAPRGEWYAESWKGNEEQSGGILYNIGVHLFDVILSILESPVDIVRSHVGTDYAAGKINAGIDRIYWRLSTKRTNQPKRVIEVDGKRFDLSKGMDDLHTISHSEISSGRGFTVEDSLGPIKLIDRIQTEATIQEANV